MFNTYWCVNLKGADLHVGVSILNKAVEGREGFRLPQAYLVQHLRGGGTQRVRVTVSVNSACFALENDFRR